MSARRIITMILSFLFLAAVILCGYTPILPQVAPGSVEAAGPEPTESAPKKMEISLPFVTPKVTLTAGSFPEDTDRDFEKREGLLFVGGFAHPPNADAVLWFVREVWPKLQADRAAAGKPAMNFYIVGSRAPEEIKALHDPENGVVVKGFVTDEELRTLYNSTRIVVVPLRYGAGVKGKVIEALYYGAPVITTGVGAEGIPEAETVMEIADAPEAFADRVNALYDDTAALAGMQEKAEEYIRSHNSLDAAWRVIEDDF